MNARQAAWAIRRVAAGAVGVCLLASGIFGWPARAAPSRPVPGWFAGVHVAVEESFLSMAPGSLPWRVAMALLRAGSAAWLDRRMAQRQLAQPARRGPQAGPAADDPMRPVMEAVSTGGHPGVTVGALAALALWDEQAAAAALARLAGALAITQAEKSLFGRARPAIGQGPDAYRGPTSPADDPWLSLPSGHTTAAFAVAAALAGRYREAAPWLSAWAAAVALSRVYLGSHWPTDVWAGSALGRWAGAGPEGGGGGP